MPGPKIIAVVGATGAQGGGLVRAIMSDQASGFTACALTRDVNSDNAKALAKLGAQVVAADEATALAKATKQAGVQHAVWSTLEDTRKWVPLSDHRMPTLMGKYKSPALRRQGRSRPGVRGAGAPTTCLLTSFYWDNFIHFGMGPKKGPDGKLAITFPMADKKLPGIAAEDIGKCAWGIFKKGREYAGKTVGIAGEHLTGSQMAAAFFPRCWANPCPTTR
jgi:uncharacterized protein YbjT (DUF2867 family)